MQSYSDSSTSLSGFLQQSCTERDGLTASDYWNIDDIMAEEELVPTVFKNESNGLGYLT